MPDSTRRVKRESARGIRADADQTVDFVKSDTTRRATGIDGLVL